MSRIILIGILIFLSNLAIAGGWVNTIHTNEMTDKKTIIASIENNESSLFLYTDENGRYIGAFWLTDLFSQIHYEPKVIMVRVDNNEPYSINIDSWEPRKIYFDLSRYTDLTDEIMKGRALILQYPASRTQRKIEKFGLSNSEKALREALIGYQSADEIEENKKKKVEEANNNYRKKLEENNSVECPDKWNKFKEMEKKYGTQIWPGCVE